MRHASQTHQEVRDGAGDQDFGALSALKTAPPPFPPPFQAHRGQETDAMTRTTNALRAFLARLFPRSPAPPRQSDIERALLRALGGL